ncbi:MAG: hypothetical protein H7X80_06910 [bacterium]|nr:hypothetical protein [Candidatus Kapabacteria bacterium]
MKSKMMAVKRYGPMLAVAALVAAGSIYFANKPSRVYLTRNPSVSQRFVKIPSEGSLVDLCYRLRDVQGVTGVSYRDYAPADQSATVTIYFDAQATSVRQLRIFMLHSKLLWQKEINV